MNGLVSQCQSAFIAQRHIQDKMLVVSETLDFAKRFNKDCLVLKIDFKQEGHYIYWDYLRYVMKIMNFGNKWLQWMEVVVFINSLSILVNGCTISEIQVGRGLIQGDLISPFLFILATEGHPGMVKNVMISRSYNGFSLNENIHFDIL